MMSSSSVASTAPHSTEAAINAAVLRPIMSKYSSMDIGRARSLAQMSVYWPLQIGRAQVGTQVTPISTLFPYTTLFRSGGDQRGGLAADHVEVQLDGHRQGPFAGPDVDVLAFAQRQAGFVVEAGQGAGI